MNYNELVKTLSFVCIGLGVFGVGMVAFAHFSLPMLLISLLTILGGVSCLMEWPIKVLGGLVGLAVVVTLLTMLGVL